MLHNKDLADLYSVETKRINEQVKRCNPASMRTNSKKFLNDFMFHISNDEKYELITKCDNLQKLKNQTVKQNIENFPNDFIFDLTQNEKEEVVTNCDYIQNEAKDIISQARGQNTKKIGFIK